MEKIIMSERPMKYVNQETSRYYSSQILYGNLIASSRTNFYFSTDSFNFDGNEKSEIKDWSMFHFGFMENLQKSLLK